MKANRWKKPCRTRRNSLVPKPDGWKKEADLLKAVFSSHVDADDTENCKNGSCHNWHKIVTIIMSTLHIFMT